MIHEESELEVADNSGAKKVKCFRVPGGSKRRYAGVGDVVICSVKKADPNGVVKKKDVVKVLIVRTKSYINRADGSKIRFDTNSGIILNDKGEPKGTRVFGPVAREIRDRGHVKVCSLAPEVI